MSRLVLMGAVMPVQFRVLGNVEALADGAIIDFGSSRQRYALVALLAEPNRVIPADQLVDRVWGDRAPRGARGTLRTYLSRLRKGLATAGAGQISHRSGGYVITVDPLLVDLHRFGDLVAQARAAGTPGNADKALALLSEALGLWRGEAFAGSDTPWINSLRESVDAMRIAAELDYTDLRLGRGEHGALLAELTRRAAARPLDERIAGQLMHALYGVGRTADALDVYARTRKLLAEELGIDPGHNLQQLYQAILRGETLTPPGQQPQSPEVL